MVVTVVRGRGSPESEGTRMLVMVVKVSDVAVHVYSIVPSHQIK